MNETYFRFTSSVGPVGCCSLIVVVGAEGEGTLTGPVVPGTGNGAPPLRKISI